MLYKSRRFLKSKVSSDKWIGNMVFEVYGLVNFKVFLPTRTPKINQFAHHVSWQVPVPVIIWCTL